MPARQCGAKQARAIVLPPHNVKRGLNGEGVSGKGFRMSEQPRNKVTQSGALALSREERLAARLRENLRRRKTQARQIDAAHNESGAQGLSNPTHDS